MVCQRRKMVSPTSLTSIAKSNKGVRNDCCAVRRSIRGYFMNVTLHAFCCTVILCPVTTETILPKKIFGIGDRSRTPYVERH
uniref:Secreted protein n=1 Tax=Ascaris lumbricoides TaxID=6252 RepID=A0A0M3HNA5_ASCLU